MRRKKEATKKRKKKGMKKRKKEEMRKRRKEEMNQVAVGLYDRRLNTICGEMGKEKLVMCVPPSLRLLLSPFSSSSFPFFSSLSLSLSLQALPHANAYAGA